MIFFLFHWSMDRKTTGLTVHPVASWYFSHGWEFCQTLNRNIGLFFILFVCEWMWVLSWVNIEQFLKEKKKEKTLCAKLLNPLLLTDMSRERKEICCSYNISFQAQKQFRWNWDSSSREYAMKMLSALQLYGVGVFKSCVYPSRKWSSNYGNQRTIGLSYLLTKGRASCFSYWNSWCVMTSPCLLTKVPFSFWE